jgi:hypothetical protein
VKSGHRTEDIYIYRYIYIFVIFSILCSKNCRREYQGSMNFIVLKPISPSASRLKGSKDNKNLKMTQSCRTARYQHLSFFMIGVSFIRLDRKRLITEQVIFLLVPQCSDRNILKAGDVSNTRQQYGL